MTTIQIAGLLFGIFLGQFIFAWVPCSNKLIELPDGLVRISSNYDVNWVFTNFLAPHALAYEKLSHKINNKGMVILFVLITLATFPLCLLCAVIGLDILAAKSIWQWFCEIFKREPAFKDQKAASVKTEDNMTRTLRIIKLTKNIIEENNNGSKNRSR